MIDVSTEELLTLAAAGRLQCFGGRTGEGVNPATVWRWAIHGVRGVRLETVVVGACRLTSKAAVQRFIEATTAAAEARIKRAVPEAPKALRGRRLKQVEAAERKLATV